MERNSVRRDQRHDYLALKKKDLSDSVTILRAPGESADYRSAVLVLFKDTNRRFLFIQ